MKQSSNILRRSLAFGSLLLGASLGFACGSDDGADDGAGAGTGGHTHLDTGSGGNGNGNGGPRVGGSVDLSEQEVNDILNASCTGWSGEGEALPAVLQLVVDTSGSMDEDAPGSDDSKWDVTSDALASALESLPPSVSTGMLLYPNQNTQRNSEPGDVEDCVNTDAMISIDALGQSGSEHRQQLADALANANVRSYTPTHDAFDYALEQGLVPYQGNATKFMLLITDGAPTLAQGCVNPGGRRGVSDAPTQPIVDLVETARTEHGIRTFLIGSPGSEESSNSGGGDMRPWLSRAAVVGGTAPDGCDEDGPNFCHMDMTQEPDFAAALSDALASIAGQIIDSCTFAMPDPPEGERIDPSLTNVIITWGSGQSTLILGDDTADCSVGWQANGTDELTLCEETCKAVKADSNARLHLAFGCGVDVIPVR